MKHFLDVICEAETKRQRERDLAKSNRLASVERGERQYASRAPQKFGRFHMFHNTIRPVAGLFLVAVIWLTASASNAADQSVGGQANVWIGNERLDGYGRLEFRFYENGSVVMIDARETCNGSFSQNGNSITLTFPGRAIYYGAINGNSIWVITRIACPERQFRLCDGEAHTVVPDLNCARAVP